MGSQLEEGRVEILCILHPMIMTHVTILNLTPGCPHCSYSLFPSLPPSLSLSLSPTHRAVLIHSPCVPCCGEGPQRREKKVGGARGPGKRGQ